MRSTASGRPILLLLVLTGAAIVVGQGIAGRGASVASPNPPGSLLVSAGPVGAGDGDPAMLAGIPTTRRARVVVDLEGHLDPGGPPFRDSGGPTVIERGQDVVILGDPVTVGATEWVRVYVIPYTSGAGPSDFFTWLPLMADGQAVLIDVPQVPCPAAPRGLDVLAQLDQLTRLRCQGSDGLSITGITWTERLPVWYGVVPAWMGGANEPNNGAFSIHSGEIQRELATGEVAHFLDVQLPDDLERPPLDFVIDLRAHFADTNSGRCERTDLNGLVPDEKAVDSRLWCASRLVAEQWTVTLGPERRPPDVLAPQLHRFQPFDACGGVGMPMLTFRMDPQKLDPIWLEAPGGGSVVPWFGPEFHAGFGPNLELRDGTGRVVARDGTPVNPDEDLFGHGICPTINGVYFN